MGETLETISNRTGMSVEHIQEMIPKLQTLGLGIFNPLNNKLIPSTTQVHIETKVNETHFKDFYLHCQELQKKMLLDKGKNVENLFYNEVFSINQEMLPELRERLKDLLKSFVLKCENPEGNSVVVLNAAFTRQRFESTPKD